MTHRPPRIVVCGTRFGEHYLSALTAENSGFELAGIVARGSERSKALAKHFGVPLFPDIDAIPDGLVDMACIVVRTALFGGNGTKLAEAFLQRGIPVLQEHPVHPGEVARLKRLAKRNGAHYHVNTFYPYLPAGSRWIDYVSQAMRGGIHPPQFLELTTSPQLLYSSLDLLGRAIGGLKSFSLDGSLNPEKSPFHIFTGQVNDIPFSLNFQSFLDPSDPDHHSLIMHKMSAIWPEGTVQLANSFGPVLWSSALYAPNYDRNDLSASYILSPEKHRDCRYYTQPSAQPLGDAAGAPVRDVVVHQFPIAIRTAVSELHAAIEASASSEWQGDDYLFSLGQAWLKIMQQAGQPKSVSMPPPPPPFPDPVEFARQQDEV